MVSSILNLKKAVQSSLKQEPEPEVLSTTGSTKIRPDTKMGVWWKAIREMFKNYAPSGFMTTGNITRSDIISVRQSEYGAVLMKMRLEQEFFVMKGGKGGKNINASMSISMNFTDEYVTRVLEADEVGAIDDEHYQDLYNKSDYGTDIMPYGAAPRKLRVLDHNGNLQFAINREYKTALVIGLSPYSGMDVSVDDNIWVKLEGSVPDTSNPYIYGLKGYTSDVVGISKEIPPDYFQYDIKGNPQGKVGNFTVSLCAFYKDIMPDDLVNFFEVAMKG